MSQVTHAFVRKDLTEAMLAIPSVVDDSYYTSDQLDGSIVLEMDDDGNTRLRLNSGHEVIVQSIDLEFTTTSYGG